MKKTLILFFVSVILFAQTNTQPFKNIEEGNNFRLWVNQNYPEYAKKIKLGKTGSFTNSYIQKAYKKFGKEYLKLITPPPPKVALVAWD